jgi:GTPase SAR1 family protein
MITALIGHRGVGKTALLKRAPQQKSSTSAGNRKPPTYFFGPVTLPVFWID